MTELGTLWLSVLLYLAGAVLSLVFARQEKLAIRASSLAGLLGGAAGLCASSRALLSGHILTFFTSGPFYFAHFTVRLDPLAALMVLVISLLMLFASLYAWSYVEEYLGRGAWAMCFFLHIFVASMIALVVCDNAFYFLVFFEAMSLSSYFLVIFDRNDEAVSAGFLYFLIAHAGSVLIMIAFFLLYSKSGSLDFASFRALHLTGPLASVVFLLAFFGFGAKAGMVPVHSWLPRAHPAAPSHASALMSGVMVKIGVFGIIKVGVDLLGAQTSWWGIVVLGFGAVSAVLGVLYALAEQDLKRLLAYSTVENVGIILLGVGAGMIGIATHHPVLAALGLMAGLYHLLNHAVFKGLLFFGVGSILYRTHTRNMDELGGLARLMPRTALAFLIGAMAICALPPLNGFVSEWFTYQALFGMSVQGGQSGELALRIAGPIAIVMLALTGAFAALCFVKAYGISFSGLPRSEHAAHAREVPLPMWLATLLLALGAIVLGVGARWIAPLIAQIASSLVPNAALQVVAGSRLVPGNPAQAILSNGLLTVLVISLPLLMLVLASLLRGPRLSRRHSGDAWACGYKTEASMMVSGAGITQPIGFMFTLLYLLRRRLSPARALDATLEQSISATTRAEPFWDQKIILPIVRTVDAMGARIQGIQGGDFRLYCLYVMIALALLLVLTVR